MIRKLWANGAVLKFSEGITGCCTISVLDLGQPGVLRSSRQRFFPQIILRELLEDDRIHKKVVSILFGHPLGTLLASCCKLNCHNWHLIKIVVLVSSIITQCEKKVMTSWWVSHNWLGETEFGDDYWSNNSDNWKSDYERLTHPKLDSSGNREITKIQKYREKY